LQISEDVHQFPKVTALSNTADRNGGGFRKPVTGDGRGNRGERGPGREHVEIRNRERRKKGQPRHRALPALTKGYCEPKAMWQGGVSKVGPGKRLQRRLGGTKKALVTKDLEPKVTCKK